MNGRFGIFLTVVMGILFHGPFVSLAYGEQWVMSVQHADLSPFKHRNGHGPGGINVDILDAIANEVGADLIFRDFTIAQGREKFQQGQVTVDCCLNKIWFPDQDNIQLFSDPIYRLIEVFVFPKDKAFPVPDTTVLRDKKVAGIKGFTYPGQENYGTRIDGDNPLEVLKMVEQGLVDVAVLERHAASFYINHNEMKVQFGDLYYSVDVSVRLHKSLSHRLDEVNKAIAKLKKTGRISAIIQRNIR
ncbi:transporter substrate-binding domain-containing protein [Terasakiella sp. SH-1]|uniref:substrate-binding periplasmic protein n=1 Tax=Terasakiella sp. SH-1 TaxID=2560057 RepID=UPI0010749C0C|nr:transporter substrate-binding domain-containing protein [Terasakiella sp. SH-1]